MKKIKKPLALDKESIRLLASRDLAEARGGVGVPVPNSDRSECPTCTSC